MNKVKPYKHQKSEKGEYYQLTSMIHAPQWYDPHEKHGPSNNRINKYARLANKFEAPS